MLNGLPATYQEFKTGASYGTLLPAHFTGSSAPDPGEPEFFAEIGSAALHLWRFSVDWNNPANSTLSGPSNLAVASYNPLCLGTQSCIPQPGTGVGLDGLGDRLMNRLVYRRFKNHESLLVSHNVNVLTSGTQAAVRWYEIRDPNSSPAIYQQGTYAPDSTNRWLGSLAIDRIGDIALGYSVSSGTTFPGIRYTGRLSGDGLGVMTQGEAILIDGGGSQTGTGYRWGDYASMSVDPVDGCTFWFTSEYIPTNGSAPWKTRIGTFRFPSCTDKPPVPTPKSTATSTSTLTSTTQASTATSTTTPTPTATATPTPTPTSTPNPTKSVSLTSTPTNIPNPGSGQPFLLYLPLVHKGFRSRRRVREAFVKGLSLALEYHELQSRSQFLPTRAFPRQTLNVV
jgi:hypothetical protein